MNKYDMVKREITLIEMKVTRIKLSFTMCPGSEVNWRVVSPLIGLISIVHVKANPPLQNQQLTINIVLKIALM